MSDWSNEVIGNDLITIYKDLHFPETLFYGSRKPCTFSESCETDAFAQIELLYARHDSADQYRKSIYRKRCYAASGFVHTLRPPLVVTRQLTHRGSGEAPSDIWGCRWLGQTETFAI
jgi:hypothetical protein